MVRARVGTGTGMVRGDVGAGVGVVHGATGGGEEAERGVARAYHDQAGRVGIHGDLGAGFAQYLLHDVASDLASGVHAERLPERSPQTLLAAVLYVLRADAYPGATGLGARCAVTQEPRHDAHGL